MYFTSIKTHFKIFSVRTHNFMKYLSDCFKQSCLTISFRQNSDIRQKAMWTFISLKKNWSLVDLALDN